jgi:hypothetical protein
MQAWYSSHHKAHALSEVRKGSWHEEKSSLDPARIKLMTLSTWGQCLTPRSPGPTLTMGKFGEGNEWLYFQVLLQQSLKNVPISTAMSVYLSAAFNNLRTTVWIFRHFCVQKWWGVIPSHTTCSYVRESSVMIPHPCKDHQYHQSQTTLISLVPLLKIMATSWQNKQPLIMTYTTNKKAFLSWKSRGNKWMNVPKFFCYAFLP